MSNCLSFVLSPLRRIISMRNFGPSSKSPRSLHTKTPSIKVYIPTIHLSSISLLQCNIIKDQYRFSPKISDHLLYLHFLRSQSDHTPKWQPQTPAQPQPTFSVCLKLMVIFVIVDTDYLEVLGAGPAGLATVLGLSRLMHTCIVFSSSKFRNDLSKHSQ